MSEEMVDLVDDKDNVIRSVPRSVMRADKNAIHRATGVIVFNTKGEILIHKRTMTKDKMPEYLDITIGGVVDSSENYEENVYREVEEEIGIKEAKLQHLFKLKNIDVPLDKHFIEVYKLIHDGPFEFQEEEIEWGKFVSIHELNEMIKTEKFIPVGIKVFKKYLEEYHEKD